MNFKVNGFTLLEALVSLLLSSILVVFTFSIYSNFNRYYWIYTRQTEQLNTISNFKTTFNRDWNMALSITGTETETETETALLLSNQEQTITYHFNDSTITRVGTSNSKFSLIPHDITLNTAPNNENITKFTLEVEQNQHRFLFSFDKDYGIIDEVQK